MQSATTQTGVMPVRRSSSKWVWVLQILAALAFLYVGGAKVAGLNPEVTQLFDKIGIGQWFRYLTGGLEVIGAIALLVPRFTAFGALLLSCVMVGAVITHLFVVGGSPVPAIVLLVFTGSIAWLRLRK
jgi:putative oxidoreductase